MVSGLKATLVAGLASISLAACGSDTSSSEKNASVDPDGVQACLQEGGYGVTDVPHGQTSGDGSDPGQTSEMLVAKGKPPGVDGNDATAVIAFWKTSADAEKHVQAVKKDNGGFIETSGQVTVEAGPAFTSVADIKPIEACAL